MLPLDPDLVEGRYHGFLRAAAKGSPRMLRPREDSTAPLAEVLRALHLNGNLFSAGNVSKNVVEISQDVFGSVPRGMLRANASELCLLSCAI